MHTAALFWAAHNEEVWLRRRRRFSLRRSLEQIDEIPEGLFVASYRLDKETFRNLCSELQAHTSLRGTNEIPLEVKVLCALSFLATGSYQRIVGVSLHLPQRTTSRAIREVVDALESVYMTKKYIQFPQTHQERSRIRQEFQRRFNLPGVVGCIDCTHISIVRPSEEEHLFFNRKGYHSLNVQMICDHNLMITNVNAKFGGATHDSFIWSSSQGESFMRGLHRSGEQTWLLGDSGYPQRPWLMTPILNTSPGSREEDYTRRHILARNCIERCFGLLKARWRCLLKHRTLHYHPFVAGKIVNACCVLHNIAQKASLPPIDIAELPADDDEDDFCVEAGPSVQNSQNDLMLGRATLNALLDRMLCLHSHLFICFFVFIG